MEIRSQQESNKANKPLWRALVGKPWKQSYGDLRLANLQTESWGITVSPTNLAFLQQSQTGVVSIIRLVDIGRSPPRVTVSGHRGPIQDVAFAPWDASLLGTASDDSTVKVWRKNNEAWRVSFAPTKKAHTKKVYFFRWSHAVSGLFASGGSDSTVAVWSTENAETPVRTWQHDGSISSLEWDQHSTKLCIASKDKTVSISDLRTPSNSTIKIKAHEGIKSAKCCFLDGPVAGDNYLLTTGFSKTAGRQVKLYDIRSVEHGAVQEIAHESGSGFLLPHWVEHAGILMIVPRGETSIRTFAFERGTLQRLEPFRASTGQRAVGFLPSVAVDPSQQEIVRVYKGEDSGTTITPISFVVEKKDKSIFYKDLFPACIAPKPASDVQAWAANNCQQVAPLRFNYTLSGEHIVPAEIAHERRAGKGTSKVGSYARASTLRKRLSSAKSGNNNFVAKSSALLVKPESASPSAGRPPFSQSFERQGTSPEQPQTDNRSPLGTPRPPQLRERDQDPQGTPSQDPQGTPSQDPLGTPKPAQVQSQEGGPDHQLLGTPPDPDQPQKVEPSLLLSSPTETFQGDSSISQPVETFEEPPMRPVKTNSGQIKSLVLSLRSALEDAKKALHEAQ